MATSDELLAAIDAKVGALLALTIDSYLRTTGTARPKERSIDQMLSDAGLPAATIARLLGKTDRAVQLQLQKEREKKSQGKEAKKA